MNGDMTLWDPGGEIELHLKHRTMKTNAGVGSGEGRQPDTKLHIQEWALRCNSGSI